jgi:hypothetical protein
MDILVALFLLLISFAFLTDAAPFRGNEWDRGYSWEEQEVRAEIAHNKYEKKNQKNVNVVGLTSKWPECKSRTK